AIAVAVLGRDRLDPRRDARGLAGLPELGAHRLEPPAERVVGPFLRRIGALFGLQVARPAVIELPGCPGPEIIRQGLLVRRPGLRGKARQAEPGCRDPHEPRPASSISHRTARWLAAPVRACPGSPLLGNGGLSSNPEPTATVGRAVAVGSGLNERMADG